MLSILFVFSADITATLVALIAHFKDSNVDLYRSHLKKVNQGSGQGPNRFESRVSEHTREYVSILNRLATPPWALRRLLEMGSSICKGRNDDSNTPADLPISSPYQ